MPRDPEAPAPQLYLITPPLADAEAFRPLLEAALAAGPVACLRLRLAPGDPNAAKKIVKALAPLAQARECAVLIDDDAQLAARAGLDGVHCDGFSFGVGDVVESMRPDRIVGVGRLASRDDCMTAGEMEVDYLMFGGPDDPLTGPEIVERAQWWAEIFNTPCVAFAPAIADIAALLETSAEFFALGEAVWAHEGGPGAGVRAAFAAMQGRGAKGDVAKGRPA